MTRALLHHDNIALAGSLAVLARQQCYTTQTQLPDGNRAAMTRIIPISIRGRYFWRGDERASEVSLKMHVWMF